MTFSLKYVESTIGCTLCDSTSPVSVDFMKMKAVHGPDYVAIE